jgi:phosphate/sulfate permease
MQPLTILLFATSAFFAWSMGSHYTGAVMGAAYGAGAVSLRTGLLLVAAAAVVGSVVASVKVVDTYAFGLVSSASPVDVTAALLAAAITTTVSTAVKLPTSTIQIYASTLVGVALVGHLPIHAAGFGLLILAWIVGPLLAFVLGFLISRAGRGRAHGKGRLLRWFVIIVSVFSALTLGSNDVSNAVSSLAMLHLLTPRMAGLFGGVFMALGALTWGQRLLHRIGKEIVPVSVPLAAIAQLAQAATISLINGVGYNASINQTIVGALAGAGSAAEEPLVDRRVLRNILLGWLWSPLLGVSAAAAASVVLRRVFHA